MHVINISVARCRLTITKDVQQDGWITLKMELTEYLRNESSLLTRVRSLYFDYLRNKKMSFTNAVLKEFDTLSSSEIEDWFPSSEDDIMKTVISLCFWVLTWHDFLYIHFWMLLQINHKNTETVLEICKKNFAQGQRVGDGLELAAICWVGTIELLFTFTNTFLIKILYSSYCGWIFRHANG
jgi:hypothetical protein